MKINLIQIAITFLAVLTAIDIWIIRVFDLEGLWLMLICILSIGNWVTGENEKN